MFFLKQINEKENNENENNENNEQLIKISKIKNNRLKNDSKEINRLLSGDKTKTKISTEKTKESILPTTTTTTNKTSTTTTTTSVIKLPPSTSSRKKFKMFQLINKNKLILINKFLLIILITIITFINKTNCLLLDTTINTNNGGISSSSGINSNVGSGSDIYIDKTDYLERSIAAVFNKVAYGSTTTKRSIPDNVFVPSLTTVPTPLLTTFRYRERDKDINQDHQGQQQVNSHNNRNYEIDLERDHALPTSAPNADILKSNNNPTYPNPNRHHNHDRERHRHQNSTPIPSGHSLKKIPTIPMYPGDMPSYSPPARSFFTPPLPPEYQNPFADKPTLRGTNSDSSLINIGTFTNRRPIPPPSLMPGHERIPFRPPDLVGQRSSTAMSSSSSSLSSSIGSSSPDQPNITYNNQNHNDNQRKKALNTPSQKLHNKNNDLNIEQQLIKTTDINVNNSEIIQNNGGLHFPSISRILSGSNGRKEDIPEVLLRTVTVRPSFLPPILLPSMSPPQTVLSQDSTVTNLNRNRDEQNNNQDNNNQDNQDDTDDDINDDFDFNNNHNINIEEPKTQPKIKSNIDNHDDNLNTNNNNNIIYSTQMIQNLANMNNDRNYFTTTISTLNNNNNNHNNMNMNNNNNNIRNGQQQIPTIGTWTIAWNIHVYLSAILFTILAVYSIFKMIFYDKLTHLFNQSYFICIHLILIMICLARIFFLCYDAYNIHGSFHIFLSELLLNLPATFLTVSFSILILFLLIRSLNHKNNRYSALMRPLTVVVGSSVHVGLCITLHYVESYGTQTQMNYRQNIARGSGGTNGLGGGNSGSNTGGNNNGSGGNNYHSTPPRVLSLICQIIYIFVCISLGLLYLCAYRMLKRVLRNKSQNYIHGYQNLSYAIHITIASALLFLLLAALQIYGAFSISTTRPLITSSTDIDWLQWGYQFSLRLIEIAIIILLSWVTGLKTGASKVLQREKGIDTHNVSGFALFPCTSSSSQEHFETDYPAVCNANTNLHTYTLRTGKPIYDDNFALNSLGCNDNNAIQQQQQQQQQQIIRGGAGGPDFQLGTTNNGEFSRSYETNSVRSSTQNSDRIIIGMQQQPQQTTQQSQINDVCDYLNDSGTIPDHYENPNFELRTTTAGASGAGIGTTIVGNPNEIIDNSYSEPLNHQESYEMRNGGGGGASGSGIGTVGGPQQQQNFDFQNFERPNFDRPSSRNEFRASKNLKAMKNNNLERGHYENPERRSSNSNHSYNSSGRNYNNFNYNNNHNNSFERGRGGVRKSGTLNNIGGIHHGRNNGGGNQPQQQIQQQITNNRASGVQTLSSSRSQDHYNNIQRNNIGRSSISTNNCIGGNVNGNINKKERQQQQQQQQQQRSSLERSSTGHLTQGINGQNYIMPDDEYNSRNYDNSSNSGSDIGVNGIGITTAQTPATTTTTRQCYPPDRPHFTNKQSQRQFDTTNNINDQQQSSSGDSATSGSMLVAEHGFVRFRALDEQQLQQQQQQLQQQQQQQQPIPAVVTRTTGRSGKEKRFTNT